MVIVISIIALLVTLLIGVGIGGANVRKEVYKDIKRLEYSKISDGQFRDIVVNTYVADFEIKEAEKQDKF